MDRLHRQHLLERLFASYRQELVAYVCKKFRKEPACAEDITQDAFMRIQRLENLSDIQNHRAHLYKTASNLAIDHQRREKSRDQYVQRQMPVVEELAAPSPETHIGAQRQLDELEAIVAKLPSNCRQAFIWHRLHGMSYSQIAEKLDVSVSSVEKYIYRTLKACRSHVEKSEG